MNQHDRPSFALHHKVQVGVVDLHEERIGARMVVGHTAGDESLLESAGNFHDLN
jgi:hypothetical protein